MVTTTIIGDDMRFELMKLDFMKGERELMLTIKDESGDIIEIWDNTSYLEDEFPKILKGDIDVPDEDDLLSVISYNDFGIIVDLYKKGQELNFFKTNIF